MSLSCDSRLLSGRGLCGDGPITRSREVLPSVMCLNEGDLEDLTKRRPRPLGFFEQYEKNVLR